MLFALSHGYCITFANTRNPSLVQGIVFYQQEISTNFVEAAGKLTSYIMQRQRQLLPLQEQLLRKTGCKD